MEEKILKVASLVYLVKNGRVCMSVKKKHIGAGYLNGAGGGLEETDATIEECACREVLDEWRVKVWPVDLRNRRIALLRCHNRTEQDEGFICTVHVFYTTFWLGIPQESDELGPPEWFPIGELPYSRLMLGDREWMRDWFPKLIAGAAKLIVTSWYGPRQALLDKPTTFEEVKELPKE